MSLEEILHTFNSPPSKMINLYWMLEKHSQELRDWLRARGHYKAHSFGYVYSLEASDILSNSENVKTLETYLAF